jgi:hypothetical protein
MKNVIAYFLLGICFVFILGVASQEQIVNIAALNGSGWRPTSGDTSTRSLTNISYEHHEIHEGEAYVTTYAVDTLDDTDTAELLIETPNTTKWAHLIVDVMGTHDTTIVFSETSTKTTGTAMNEVNRNRNSGNTAGIVVTHTPGGAGAGTTIYTAIFGADATPASGGVFGNHRGRAEFILKQNEKYLLVVTSATDGNRVSIFLNWYEHTDKD